MPGASARPEQMLRPCFFLAIKTREGAPDNAVVSYARAGLASRRMKMLDRRHFMKTFSGMGLAGTLFSGVLWAQAPAQGAQKTTKEMNENRDGSARVPSFRREQRHD